MCAKRKNRLYIRTELANLTKLGSKTRTLPLYLSLTLIHLSAGVITTEITDAINEI